MSANVDARAKYLLNKMNAVANDVQLGTMLEAIDTSLSGINTLADGKIYLGNASNAATEVTPTGDVTMTNAGVTAIGAAKVLKAMLGAGVRPSHIVIAAGTFTTAGGDANEAITVTGALGTDLAFCQLKTVGTGSRTILSATAATDAINVVMSGDPTTDHVIYWQILRATS